MFRKLNIFAFFICFCELVKGECDVVTKKQWGGLEPTHVQYLPRPVDLVIIQHTATPMCTTDKACKNRVKNIQDYHMDTLNWWDIGSSFYVGGNGKVYEGAGWLHVGAHTYGYNKRSIGISFIGNYETDVPTAQQLNAVKALLGCGVENGHLTSNYHVIGHKQLLATLSPGRNLWAEIRTWPEWMDDVSSIKN
uniref:Peptidoglycan-recognition protein n=1 Tax=Ostrinia furnacalis TaxID=93504 RepID=B7SFX0_OSTFU|nr:peptidoglycan recognition protein [Ostrinia furnacalis]